MTTAHSGVAVDEGIDIHFPTIGLAVLEHTHGTQTVECIQDGEVLTMSYDRLLEIYFQNPEFGYYFLRLSSERLLQNIARLEKIIEQNRASLKDDGSKDTN